MGHQPETHRGAEPEDDKKRAQKIEETMDKSFITNAQTALDPFFLFLYQNANARWDRHPPDTACTLDDLHAVQDTLSHHYPNDPDRPRAHGLIN
jgi:hypothetical protein